VSDGVADWLTTPGLRRIAKSCFLTVCVDPESPPMTPPKLPRFSYEKKKHKQKEKDCRPMDKGGGGNNVTGSVCIASPVD
jgi:hypothetical protein